MLSSFSVEGFKNFEEKIEIHFWNAGDYSFHPEYITNGILNTAIIYGKNAVGKSNFGLALFDIVSHLTMNNVTPGLYDYYLNADSAEKSAFFEYEFVFGKDTILYGYQKNEKKEIESEFLMINDIVIFHIGDDNKDNNALIEDFPNLNWQHNTNMSPLKYLYYNSPLEPNHPINKMMKFINT